MEYNWLFQIIIGYYNWIFLISIVLSLACVYVCFLEVETTEKWSAPDEWSEGLQQDTK